MATTISTFAHAGAQCSDANRLLESDRWQSVVEEAGQGLASPGGVVGGLRTVQAALRAHVAGGPFNDPALARVQNIVASRGEHMIAADAAGAGAGSKGALHQLSAPYAAGFGVIDAGPADATLATLATADGTAVGHIRT